MMRSWSRRRAEVKLNHRLLQAVAALAMVPFAAASAQKPAPVRPADLATQVEGRYFGDVISDARGSSRSGVRIIVTRIGPNKVRIASDYTRLRAFDAALSRYMQTIQNVGGDQVFLFDLSKSPPSLDLTVDDASWSGTKE
jgi:hypothetical protein